MKNTKRMTQPIIPTMKIRKLVQLSLANSTIKATNG